MKNKVIIGGLGAALLFSCQRGEEPYLVNGWLKKGATRQLGLSLLYSTANYLWLGSPSGVQFIPKENKQTLPLNTLFEKTPSAMGEVQKGQLILAFGNRLGLYSNKGEALQTWPMLSEGAYITSILAVGQSILLADAGEGLIYKFHPEGRMQKIIGLPDHFRLPSPYFSLASDSESTFWVTNPGRHRVEKYDIEGNLLLYFGQHGEGPGFFEGCCNPAYVQVTPAGNVVTREKGTGRLSLFDSRGNFLRLLDDGLSLQAGSRSEPFFLEGEEILLWDRGALKRLPFREEKEGVIHG